MTHLFILNPFAGTKDSTPELKEQIEALRLPDAVIEYTQCKGDAENIARRYAEKGEPLRVYACGGDGTANEALQGLLGFENVALTLNVTDPTEETVFLAIENGEFTTDISAQ